MKRFLWALRNFWKLGEPHFSLRWRVTELFKPALWFCERWWPGRCGRCSRWRRTPYLHIGHFLVYSAGSVAIQMCSDCHAATQRERGF